MGKFKVGDRVRCIDSEGTTCVAFGREYQVTEAYGRFVLLKNVFGGMYQHRFELIETTPTITIEPGKHYRLSNGKVTGRVSQGDIGFEALVDGQVKVFDKAGGAVFGGEDIVEAWVPKVGERVRLVKDGKSTTGAVGKSATLIAWSTGTFIDNDDYLLDIDAPVDYKTLSCAKNLTRATIDCFEPLPVAAPVAAVPLQIEAGRYYKTRDGRKVGPAFIRSDFATFGTENNHMSAVWADNGRQSSRSDTTSEKPNDIIAEWVDEPAAQPAAVASNDNAAPAKFKVGDTVRILSSDWPDVIKVGEILTLGGVDDDGVYPLAKTGEDYLYYYFSEVDLVTQPTASRTDLGR